MFSYRVFPAIIFRDLGIFKSTNRDVLYRVFQAIIPRYLRIFKSTKKDVFVQAITSMHREALDVQTVELDKSHKMMKILKLLLVMTLETGNLTQAGIFI